ncbi:MAG: hypothetical protein GXN99_03060 [Candidatus Nanohaloarchaeota archaeon]|nr:hypothetical protein [Candidatus Nanohaloarchaeota archaeon]
MLDQKYYLKLNKDGRLFQQSEIILGVCYNPSEDSLKASLFYDDRLKHTTSFEQNYLDKLITFYIDQLIHLYDRHSKEEFALRFSGVFGNLKGDLMEKICCKTLYNFFKNEFLNEIKKRSVTPINQLILPKGYCLSLKREKHKDIDYHIYLSRNNKTITEFDYAVKINGKNPELLLFEIKAGRLNQNAKYSNLINSLISIVKNSKYYIKYIFFVPSNFTKDYPDFVKNYMQEVQKKVRETKKGKKRNKLLISINPIYVYVNSEPYDVDAFVWLLLQNKFKDDFKKLNYVRKAEDCYKQFCNSQANR